MGGKGRTPLRPQEVGAIKTMVANKKSNGAIATAFGIPKTVVSYHAVNARRAAATARQDNQGRPKLLSPRELRGLHRVFDDNPFASTAEIAEKVNQVRTTTAVGPPLRKVSVSTVRRAIKGLGLSSCAPAHKPFVSDINKKKRLQWAKEHRSWTYQWAWVMFSDESTFQVRQPKSRRVWRQSGERFAPKNLRPTLKSGRERVMVWGAFSAVGRTPLVRVVGFMTGASYTELLETVVVHYMCADYGTPDGAIFQEDLAPCHTAKIAKACKAALGLKVLPWVGQSPDLNPIENAWAELERRLRARPVAPKTKDELFTALQEEWASIPSAYFKKLTESMCRRVRGVVAANGSGTRY